MLHTTQPDKVVRHVEIKAFLDNFSALSERLASLSNIEPMERVQHDTFFNCRSGRLKLRSSGNFHDLIYYRRQDDYGPKESFYQSARSRNPIALRTTLASTFGIAGNVKKFRRTFRIGDALVHLDRVADLGEFIEIKIEIGEELSAEGGGKIVENLMQALDVDLFQLVDSAYVDLLNQKQNATQATSLS